MSKTPISCTTEEVPTNPQLDPTTFLQQYSPAKGVPCYATAAQWVTLRSVVLEAISPLSHLSISTLRGFLTALTRLALFAHQHGYELDIDVLLDPKLITAFLATVPKESKDPAPYLWRLSDSWGLVDENESYLGIDRRDYKAPYSHDEIAALVLAARNQNTVDRTVTLLAILFLGAGCGINREHARDVVAFDLHQHGDAWFVRTPKYCARVRVDFLPLFYEVAKERPTGRLRGEWKPEYVTNAALGWLRGRRGVPTLSVDRLRATYICALLDEGASLVDTLAWSGLQGAESLNSYLQYVTRPPMHCAHTAKGTN